MVRSLATPLEGRGSPKIFSWTGVRTPKRTNQSGAGSSSWGTALVLKSGAGISKRSYLHSPQNWTKFGLRLTGKRKRTSTLRTVCKPAPVLETGAGL